MIDIKTTNIFLKITPSELHNLNKDRSDLNSLDKTLSDFYKQREQNMEYLYGKLDIEKEINNINVRIPRQYDKPYEVLTINKIQQRLYFENIKDYPGKHFGTGKSFTRLFHNRLLQSLGRCKCKKDTNVIQTREVGVFYKYLIFILRDVEKFY
jgi:hypothetical protein